MRVSFFIFAFLVVRLSSANIVGTHMQNFNPTTNGLDFVTVQSTRTLDPGTFNLGFWGDYAFNSLPFFKSPGVVSTQKISEPNDKLLSGTFNLGLGLNDFWDVGLSLPFVLNQKIGESTQLGSFDETGLTEIRINTKARVYKDDTWAMAVVGSVNFDRIKNNPFSGSNSGPTWNLEGVIDRQIKPGLLWAFNAGYRLRSRGETITDTGVAPLSNQFIYSSALSYFYENWNTHFIFEAFGSFPTKTTSLPTDRSRSNLELLAGAKYAITPKMVMNGGITTETYHGLATPDFRIYLGLNWLMGPFLEKTPAPAPVVEPLPVIVEKEVMIEEEPAEVIVLNSINFESANDEMTASSKRDFQTTINNIKNNSQNLKKIIVEGHTDSRGSDAFNMGLSLRRANSVRNELAKGLGALAPVSAIGKGESRPVDRNDTDKGRAKNRRVELKIYRNK